MRDSAGSHEVVLFFQDDAVTKEMMYPEFEAVLDNVVGMADYAGEALQAAFVTVNGQLAVMGVVLFNIEFDSGGYADKSWNIPLRNLLDKSSGGPDLGQGSIRLACRSHCASGHQSSLWDPQTSPQGSTLSLIQQAIRENRLCLPVEAEPIMAERTVPQLGQWVQSPPIASAVYGQPAQYPEEMLSVLESEHRHKLATLVREQRQQIENINQQNEQRLQSATLAREKDLLLANSQLEKLRASHDGLQSQYIELSRQLDQLRHQNQERQDQIANLNVEHQQAVERIQQQHIEALQQQSATQAEQFQQQLEQATTPLMEEAKSLRFKLAQRDEDVRNLREELMALRKDKLRLTQEGGGKFLERLERLGINFIAFHPGAGHISIPLKNMTDYMENPIAFAAEKCKVSESHYQEWLEHYQNPECQAPLTNDRKCCDPIQRIDMPSKFVTGKSDRCDRHKTLSGMESVKASSPLS